MILRFAEVNSSQSSYLKSKYSRFISYNSTYTTVKRVKYVIQPAKNHVCLIRTPLFIERITPGWNNWSPGWHLVKQHARIQSWTRQIVRWGKTRRMRQKDEVETQQGNAIVSWWFQIFLNCSHLFGEDDTIWLLFFRWVVQPPTIIGFLLGHVSALKWWHGHGFFFIYS